MSREVVESRRDPALEAAYRAIPVPIRPNVSAYGTSIGTQFKSGHPDR